MDRLVKYIDYRNKKYGGIKSIFSQNSMYYAFGSIVVRISDHMKFSHDELNKNDFYFIIQPNDTYIFSAAPKYNKEGKMYMKIVGYSEAKDFIKRIHEYSIGLGGITNWFIPDCWNRPEPREEEPKERQPKQEERYSWVEFYTNYIKGKDYRHIQKVVDSIEHMYYGKILPGNLTEKLKKTENAYEGLSDVQYATLISKI